MNPTMPATAIRHFDNLELDVSIRVLMQDDQPLFVAKDVCENLGLANSRQVLAGLDDDEKVTLTSSNVHGNPTSSQVTHLSQILHDPLTDSDGLRLPNRGLQFVTESGLYALIFKSRKPAAKQFRKWVTSEVLPAIRTGNLEWIRHLEREAEREAERRHASPLRLMNDMLAEGTPYDLAKFTLLVDKGVDPTTAAKLTISARKPSPAPATDERKEVESPDDACLLAALLPKKEYTFQEMSALAWDRGIFTEIFAMGKRGDDAINARLGCRLSRIAQRTPSLRIFGKGRGRRYMKNDAA